jgi:hypothetical protein
MVWVKDGGGNEPTNLIALCPNCHSLHTQGHIPDSAIWHCKGILHALNHAFTKESMDLLLFVHTVAEDICYFGDGVLRCAALIAAGFVKITDTEVGQGMSFGKSALFNTWTVPPTSSHKIAPTDRGRSFVEAWLSGDTNAFHSIVGSQPPRSTGPPDSVAVGYPRRFTPGRPVSANVTPSPRGRDQAPSSPARR